MSTTNEGRTMRETARAVRAYPAPSWGRPRIVARRRAAVLRSSGALTGVYPDDYLAQLRDEWD